MSELTELDRKVAEIIGGFEIDAQGRPYTAYYDDTVQPGSGNRKKYFTPSTNGQQAMDLQREYGKSVIAILRHILYQRYSFVSQLLLLEL